MDPSHFHVGIDFGQQYADLCLLQADGHILDRHRRFANSLPGYQQLRTFLLETLQRVPGGSLDLSAEATSLYWLPFFLELEHDPQLAPFTPDLYLLNARWVSWFKRSLPEEDKSDRTDPYFIAERTRTRRPAYPWTSQPAWLPLRFLTRLRFHLTHALIADKNLAGLYLFLLYSRYPSRKPFSDPFGVTSQQVLRHGVPQWLQQPGDDLLEQLGQWSRHHLPDPAETLQKLRQVAQESFVLDEPLAQALQAGLELLLENLGFLEGQIGQLDQRIQQAAQQHREVASLVSIPGIGAVYAAGMAAEIGGLQRFFAGQKWDPKRKGYRAKNLRDVEDSVAKYAGLWWPQFSSGGFAAEDRHLAKSGNRYLRYYLVEAADGLRRHIPAYAAYYARKYQEVPKHKHKRALVLTARRSLGLIVGLLHRHELYSEEVARTA